MAKKRHIPRKLARDLARCASERTLMAEPWRLAICKLREQLAEECLAHPTENRRFQNRRLIDNFFAEIGAAPKAAKAVMSYWLFCGSPWQDQLGYNAARQQHFAELNALGLSPEFRPKGDSEDIVTELIFRLDSLASWLEAQESWLMWRMLHHEPAAWDRHDSISRQQAMDAGFIARMPTLISGISDLAIAGTVRSFESWNDLQWTKVLKSAANLAGKVEKPPSKLESWVWWRFPIFGRYRWSASEVCRAGREKFGEIDDVSNEAAFQSAWVRRGLRFGGSKSRRRRPPLWTFVVTEPVPTNIDSTYSLLTWT